MNTKDDPTFAELEELIWGKSTKELEEGEWPLEKWYWGVRTVPFLNCQCKISA
jgi:hypothetical protein